MNNNTEGTYVGIDISAKNTVISIYKSNMEEPATIITVLGEENYYSNYPCQEDWHGTMVLW